MGLRGGEDEEGASSSRALLTHSDTSTPHKFSSSSLLFPITSISLVIALALAFIFFSSPSSSPPPPPPPTSPPSPSPPPPPPPPPSPSPSPPPSPLPPPPSPPPPSPSPSPPPPSPSPSPSPPPPHSPPPPPPSPPTARPLTKLHHPVVILISLSGFRFGYQFKTITPNIQRLIRNGTEAEAGLIPVFPTLTFPNHYSIATGLYPPYHGIINNKFVDPATGDKFTTASRELKWWLGRPLWETVTANGFKAATYFWPGSEVIKGSWTCPSRYCKHYNNFVPFEDRVDTVLGYFDLPPDEMPVFMTIYVEDLDQQGHKFGPDDDEITQAVARIDSLIGRLIKGLEDRDVFEDVTIILVGDHGMVGTCDQKLIFLDDLGIPAHWVQSYSPLLAIRPSHTHAPAHVVAQSRCINMQMRVGALTQNANMLVPYADMLNHSFEPNCFFHWRFKDRMLEVLINAGRRIKKGDEMTVNYMSGMKNDMLMQKYGFSSPVNPWDTIEFSGNARIHLESFLSIFNISGLPEEYFHNNNLSNEGDTFVDGAVIAAARTLPTWSDGDVPPVPSAERKAVKTLQDECQKMLSGFATTSKQDQKLLDSMPEATRTLEAALKYRLHRKLFIEKVMQALEIYQERILF